MPQSAVVSLARHAKVSRMIFLSLCMRPLRAPRSCAVLRRGAGADTLCPAPLVASLSARILVCGSE